MRCSYWFILKLSFFAIFIVLIWRTSQFYCTNQQSIDTSIASTTSVTSSSSAPCPSLSACPTDCPSSSSSSSILLPSSISRSDIVHIAVVLSLAKEPSHIAEFHLLYESWRFIQIFSPLSEQVIIDLIVFCELPSCYQLPVNCIPLSYNYKLNLIPDCFYQKLEDQIVSDWKDYLYMTSIAFMVTLQYQQATMNYKWILRVDQDAILSPGLFLGLLRKHPIKLQKKQFGGLGHGTEFTNIRLRMIAKKLGYTHMGIHNLCSTWLVSPKDSIKIANLTTHIGRYLLRNEFGRHVPGIEDLPNIGEWPKWWRGVTSLYAGEIAINHIYSSSLSHQHEASVLDHPSDSQDSLWTAWHIHCLHNPTYFAKFRHRDDLYYFLRRSQTKRIRIIKDYYSAQSIIKGIIDEFYGTYMKNETVTGKISVRDYVTVLAWRKAYAATGAINL
ncbi:unnamed protein product [Adineta steineri]|uniref:DUF7164 domain-containing protein n=1 Tax=Adineta steineri TaxID=433720 RepID=A0A819F318_9BILA|nr:unnamed protein product [Adineta steineri]CAF3861769.1 unnamed protein product [Adineta steineri]CAF3861825.1 unnamed protein product [Adineta steineri]CAF4120066.1 unnamed protein product [Adineta steineri]